MNLSMFHGFTLCLNHCHRCLVFIDKFVGRMPEEITLAKSEALHAFGSDILLIEKYFESIRHVEVC